MAGDAYCTDVMNRMQTTSKNIIMNWMKMISRFHYHNIAQHLVVEIGIQHNRARSYKWNLFCNLTTWKNTYSSTYTLWWLSRISKKHSWIAKQKLIYVIKKNFTHHAGVKRCSISLNVYHIRYAISSSSSILVSLITMKMQCETLHIQ